MEVLALERTLTELDHLRLVNLAQRGRRGDVGALQGQVINQVLDVCAIVPPRQVPPDLVTMRSRVLLRDLATGQRQQLTLCYPADADPAAGFVSVWSPVGGSLIGLSVGGVARWTTPTGELRSAAVLAILFQPEASGDYAM